MSSEDELLTTSVMNRFRLDGRVALITGGGQGIGRGFALALGQAGAAVAVVDLDLDRAEEVAQEIKSAGGESTAIRADVTTDEDLREMVRLTVERLGSLEIAINNAGVNRNAAAEDTTLDDWDLHQRLNTRAVFRGCQIEAEYMFTKGYGKIINTASMSSILVPHPQKQISYNVSKAGVVAITRSLAAEWADRGIRVNCMSPGIIRTALIESSPVLAPLAERWLQDIPAGRLGEVSDLQGGIVYLASGVSDYMTGHNLIIEGGQTLW